MSKNLASEKLNNKNLANKNRAKLNLPYFIKYSVHFFTLKMMLKYSQWKVADKGFKITFVMNKLSMINSFEIILEK